MHTIRRPALADVFYPGDSTILQRDIRRMLDAVQSIEKAHPKALIAPHAGYVYSGPIAASAYRLLYPLREKIKRVVLLGPAHRVYVKGLAAPSVDYFQSPLGMNSH
jgi:MEMO1 family protein